MSHSQLRLKELVSLVSDPDAEGRLYEEMLALRGRYSLQSIRSFGFHYTDSAIAWSHNALGEILKRVLEYRSPASGDPGHGPGHWCRDFIHALRLAHDPELPPEFIPACILGGTLHDVGTLFLDRYADKNRAFRHSEAGALIVRASALESGLLNPEQADMLAYIIAAHTHYLKSAEVACTDGVRRKVDPYVDLADDGSPLLEVWLPRWADRLDCSGPCMIGRHYLTLAKDHEDYSQLGFYKVTFAEAMRPLLRTKEEIAAAGGKLTMLEHMRMFATSQSNASPYGKHDRGVMVKIRDLYRAWLERIIHAVVHPMDLDQETVLKSWTAFLGNNIEPSLAGQQTAAALERNFRALDAETRRAWASGFHTTMELYKDWAMGTLEFYQFARCDYGSLPGVFDNIIDEVVQLRDFKQTVY